MSYRVAVRWVPALCLFFLASTSCSRTGNAPAPAPPPKVTVGQPVEKEVTDYEEFTGRTAAVESVDIRARVGGYLNMVLFKPGADVKVDQPLFEIDPRPYQAALDKAEGEVTRDEARAARLAKDLERAQRLVATGAIGREEYDKTLGDKSEADASVKAAKANVAGAKLDLEYTKINAPIAGRISRNLIDPGNLVTANSTVLTSIVATGQMFAYFDVDENTFQHYKKLIDEGKLKERKESPVFVQLAGEDGFPHEGKIDFLENQLNPRTGTIQARARFSDPAKALTAGSFVRVRFPVGEPHKVLLIPEQAVASDQGKKYVFVVDAQNKASYRPVKLGALHDGLIVVEDGLKPGERIVVKGLQRARDGMIVDPQTANETPSAKS